MSRTFTAILILVILGSLQGQQPPVPPQVAIVPIHASEGPGATFQFTKVDDQLLAEANAVDALYEMKGLVLHDPDLQAFIDNVGRRVLGGRPVPEKVAYRFLVLRTTWVDAFARPNGSVYVTTGLLALLENEAQLAGILGHETAHVYERHSYLENRSIRKKTVVSEIIAAAAACIPSGYGGLLATVGVDKVNTVLLEESVYGYSREMESQADDDGLAAMTVAGYNPHAMAVAFELLDQDSTLEYEPGRTFYHDHPNFKRRQEKALAFADAHTPANARIGAKMDYLKAVAPVIASDINAEIEGRRLRTAVDRATRLVDAFPRDPQYQTLLGSSDRALGAKTPVPTSDEGTQDGEFRQRNRVLNMTEEEEQKSLLKTPEGQAMLKENQAKAEKAFLAAIDCDPQYALAYRELGFLYQDEARFTDAATNYRQYLQLVANTSLDRLRIARRLAEVEKLQASPAH